METLIINHRHKMRWYQRWATRKATLLLWVLFIGMCQPWTDDYLNTDIQYEDMMWYGLHLVLLLIAGLYLYYRYQKNRKAVAPLSQPLTLQDYSNYTGLSQTMLENARKSQIVTVFHDENGHIVSINP
jgi:poly-beta-1,6-N-acetyl-D-glucosamine biosynthesis protein PgaD